MAASEAHVAQVRFGLGVALGSSPPRDPRKALHKSLKAELGTLPAPLAGLPDTASLVVEEMRLRALPEAERRDARRERVRATRRQVAEELRARIRAAVATGGSFPERLAAFFANWFTVSAVRKEVAAYVGPFEREAVRPNLGGSFADLLVAVELHPAMLAYLDNVRSIGPDSPAGRRRDLGLNENLAREILELHTLGVDGGYGQADVEALARVLTGWSVDRETGRTAFYDRRHEPGANTIAGRRFADEGGDTAPAALRFLATHPSTARHLARRLVGQIVGDAPSQGAIATVERAFLDSDGDLPATFRALVDLDEAWTGALHRKVRTPHEVVLAAALALGVEPEDGAVAWKVLERMGQPWGHAPSPAGWPEDDASWLVPDAFVARVEFADAVSRQFAERVPDPSAWAEQILGPARMPETRAVLPRLDARRAVAVVLSSPEFQRR